MNGACEDGELAYIQEAWLRLTGHNCHLCTRVETDEWSLSSSFNDDENTWEHEVSSSSEELHPPPVQDLRLDIEDNLSLDLASPPDNITRN
jgi:hypothetical protein